MRRAFTPAQAALKSGLCMRPVTKEEFYSTLGAKDVVLHIPGAWDNETGYTVYWQTRSRQTIGMSDGYCDGKPAGCGFGGRYWMRA